SKKPKAVESFEQIVRRCELLVAAFRVHRSVLHREMAQHAALRRSVMKYLSLTSDRIAEISACNRLHSLEQRCCQWLLVAGDSACSDEFHLTHEFLALLLGVQQRLDDGKGAAKAWRDPLFAWPHYDSRPSGARSKRL